MSWEAYHWSWLIFPSLTTYIDAGRGALRHIVPDNFRVAEHALWQEIGRKDAHQLTVALSRAWRTQHPGSEGHAPGQFRDDKEAAPWDPPTTTSPHSEGLGLHIYLLPLASAWPLPAWQLQDVNSIGWRQEVMAKVIQKTSQTLHL